MYRPEGWENLSPQPHRPDYFYGDTEFAYIEGYGDGIEAGADAMLEGLKKQSKSQRGLISINPLMFQQVAGYLVFIPEEEDV